MSKPRLTIHIGTHKTGTTAIQNFLSQSHDSLRKQNVFSFPPLREIRKLKTSEQIDPSLINKCKEELCRAVRNSKQSSDVNSYVLSYEGFSGNPIVGYKNAPLVASQLRSISEDFDVRIIVYIRRQDEFAESMYTQLIHIGESLTFSSFLESLPANSFNWQELTGCYIKQFGADNVTVKRYGRDFLPESDSLLKEFCTLLGLNIDRLDFTLKKTGQNRGYSRDGLEIARLTNPILNSKEKDRLHQLLQQTNAKQPFESYSYFSEEERKSFYQQYSESNSKLAKELFDESDGELFPPNKTYLQTKYRGLTAETLTPFLVKAILAQTTVEKSYFLRGVAKLENKLLRLIGRS